MRPWKHFGARLSERLWPTAPTGRRRASAGNSSSISKPITTGAGSTALWGTNHLWNSKQQTTKIERTDSTKCVHKKGGREKFIHQLLLHELVFIRDVKRYDLLFIQHLCILLLQSVQVGFLH